MQNSNVKTLSQRLIRLGRKNYGMPLGGIRYIAEGDTKDLRFAF